MAQNFYAGRGVAYKHCRAVEFTASGGDKAAGTVIVSGNVVGIVYDDTADTEVGALIVEAPAPGLLVDKNTGEAWTVGDALYYDAGGTDFTTTATANTYAGYAAQAAASADTTGYIALGKTAAVLQN